MEPRQYPPSLPRTHSAEFGALYSRLLFCFVLIYVTLLISCVGVVVIEWRQEMLKVKMVFVIAISSHLACVPVWGEERVLFQAPFCFYLVQRTCSLTLGATVHAACAFLSTPCLGRFAPCLLLNHTFFPQKKSVHFSLLLLR